MGGRVEAQASFDIWRPLPFMALAIDLRGIDPSALAAWLDLPPVVEGAADLYAEATAAGDNPRDLIGSLIGEVRVGLPDGRLVGEALAELRPVAVLAGLGDGRRRWRRGDRRTTARRRSRSAASRAASR